MQDKDPFLTIAEAAEFLNVSKTSLRRWSRDGRLRCYRVGPRGERRFRRGDLLAFVDGSDPSSPGLPDSSRDPMHDSSWNDIPIRPPCHVCTMFRNEDEQWYQIRPYLLAHLVAGAQTVYLYRDERQEVLNRLGAENLDGGVLIEDGRLVLAPWSETYLSGGRFDSDRMLGDCAEVIDRYLSAGTQRLLLTGEMAWCASGLPGCGELVQYETALNQLLRNHPRVTAVCQYSLAEVPATVIFDNLRVHPYVQLTEGLATGLNSRSEV